MNRRDYAIFSPGNIGALTLSNRLVRSATWDPCILAGRKMTDDVLSLYRQLALGGVGLIVTGSFPVAPAGLLDVPRASFDDAAIDGSAALANTVHRTRPDCMIVAQLDTGDLSAGVSDIPSPFRRDRLRPLAPSEIRAIVDYFVQAIARMREWGFDGVQLHAAYGTLLSCFLSPFTNRRQDEYGGTAHQRARIVREIVTRAREMVGDFPILIKMNGADYLQGGIDLASFPELAAEIESCGVDAIEISGGMWDCLVRSEAELGFRPAPIPEAHTRIGRPDRQSYFLPYAEALHLHIPVILVGGNRDVERLEQIIRQGKADFIALCRPLISEPALPLRWLEGRGRPATECVSCNSCAYAIFQPNPAVVSCLFRHDKAQHKLAQAWLASWVEKNRIP